MTVRLSNTRVQYSVQQPRLGPLKGITLPLQWRVSPNINMIEPVNKHTLYDWWHPVLTVCRTISEHKPIT
jgi:hypothetical protein